MKAKHRLTGADIERLFGAKLVQAKGPKPKRLTVKQFEAAFGFRPAKKLSARKRRRAKDADELFTDMYVTYGVASLEIFLAAATELHGMILNDMSECPKFVLTYMKQQLEPSVVKRSRDERAAKLKSSIRRQQTVLDRIA